MLSYLKKEAHNLRVLKSFRDKIEYFKVVLNIRARLNELLFVIT